MFKKYYPINNYIIHKINFLCVPNNRTSQELELMYKIPLQLGVKIKYFDYCTDISTSNIIKRIKDRDTIGKNS